MDIERQHLIRDLCMSALDIDKSDRVAWLRAKCEGDSELFEEVLPLLELDAEGFLDSPLLVTDPSDLIGRDVGGFTIKEVLGAGGMGVVFRARQREPDRDVALKVLRQFSGAEGIARFGGEVVSVTKLDHPGVVRVIASGTDGELRWYAMDLVEGWSLQALIDAKEKALELPEGAPRIESEKVCADLVAQLLDALSHAHERGVIHRDVKPANVLVDEAGRVRLADFGLARDLDVTGVSGTRQVAGTLAYMSPEQARSLKDGVDARSDVYSVGAVLYAMLGGKPPHVSDNGAALLQKVLNERPAPIASRVPSVDAGLGRVCDTALRRDIEHRYVSAEAMRRDLQLWLDGERTVGRRLSFSTRLRGISFDRRTLLRGIPIAGAGGAALGLFAAKSCGRGEATEADVTLTLSPEDQGATIIYEEADGFGEVREAREVGVYRRAGQAFELPVGRGRVTAVVGARSVAFDRWFEEGTNLIGRCRPMPTDVDDGWVDIAGGRSTVPVALNPMGGSAPALETKDVSVGTFAITRALISHGEFWKGMQACASWMDDLLERLRSATEETERTDWDELPATSVPMLLARRFAEHYGWRLPTSGEWRLAVEGGDRSWFERADASEFRLGLAEPGIAFQQQAKLAHYEKHVRPSADPRYRLGPAGLFHPVGNVEEWTTSPAPFFKEASSSEPSLQPVVTRGLSWFAAADFDASKPLESFGMYVPGDSDWSVGFRCVKNAPPSL